VFARPYFKEKGDAKMDERLQTWVKNLADQDTSSYAWVFPQCARHEYSHGYNCCPGEAVLIKERFRA
jgi:hypothetical protein